MKPIVYFPPSKLTQPWGRGFRVHPSTSCVFPNYCMSITGLWLSASLTKFWGTSTIPVEKHSTSSNSGNWDWNQCSQQERERPHFFSITVIAFLLRVLFPSSSTHVFILGTVFFGYSSVPKRFVLLSCGFPGKCFQL